MSLTCYRANGNSKTVRSASGKIDVEDGEIEDAKLSDPAVIESPPIIAVTKSEPAPEKPVDPAAEVLKIAKPVEPSITPQQDSIPQTLSQTPFISENDTPKNTSQIKPASSAVPSNAPVPARPEASRNNSANSTNNRVLHSLPSRPEPPTSRIVDNRMSDRPGERGLRDHARDPRFQERTRPERPGDLLRDRLPDHSLQMSYSRGYDQNSERSHIPDRNRMEPAWGEEKQPLNRPSQDDRHGASRREPRPTVRDDRIERAQRDRSFPESQHHTSRTDPQGQLTRDSTMAPPRTNIPQHPDRAALIHGSQDPNSSLSNQHSDRRSDSRYDNYANYERVERGSRGASPARLDDRRHPRQEGRRDDRAPIDNRRMADSGSHSHSSRYEESHLPTGPRVDRSGTNGSLNQNDRFRESMKVSSTTMPATDSSHGRLSQEPDHHNRQEESQYGRLNTGSDIPSGPRLPNGNNHLPMTRGNRNVSAPQPQTSYPQTQNAPPKLPPPLHIPDKQAPTGPSIRGTTRTSASYSRTESTSAPPTPANETPDTAGVHPDRLKAIQGQVVPPISAAPQTQGSITRSTQQSAPAIVATAPVGPRGPNTQLPSPAAPSPTNRGPPTGPSFGGDRNRGDKRFAGLQTVLQQANTPNGLERSGQGASIRGRGGRANMNVSSPSTSGPPTPSISRAEQFTLRDDLFAGKPSGIPGPPHDEEDFGYGRGGRRVGIRDMARDGDRRSERHRGNHSPGREKTSRPSMPLRDEEMFSRREDLRERGRGGPAEREMRRPGRDDPNRDRRLELDRREMAEWTSDGRGGLGRDDRDRRDGGGSGRKRGRGGDEMDAMDRVYADNKRPRRNM